MTGYRADTDGAWIDRSQAVRFTFDGQTIDAFAGDTVASALIAAGHTMVARSFKYHRPRGVFSAGAEEPNALVTVGKGSYAEPNVKATMAPVRDGLAVTSQNAWPSLRHDIGAVNQLFAQFIGAGFYYKTFMGPVRGAWMAYEPLIRRAAGMGRGTLEPDPGRYEHANAFCDVLVVGAGAAGLTATLASARSGANTIMLDENAAFGGGLDLEAAVVDDQPFEHWHKLVRSELGALPNVRILSRTCAYGYYDGNLVAAVEDCDTGDESTRRRHWRILAKQIVLATGAQERPIVFDGNDRPGIMLASAGVAYMRRFSTAPGRAIAVFVNNDAGWRHAVAMVSLGLNVTAVIDPRDASPAASAEHLAAAGATILNGRVVSGTTGGTALTGLLHRRHGLPGSDSEWLACDALLVSGGLSPNIALASQAGSAPIYDERIGAFLPGEPREAWIACGAAAGKFAPDEALKDGASAGARAAKACGFKAEAPLVAILNQDGHGDLEPIYEVPASRSAKAFVDLQHDVTAEDVRQANREGFRSVEHLKRYTTLGMANDQGRTSNLNGLAIMAAARGATIAEVGTTRFRAPAEPVPLGVLAGRRVGAHFQPTRRTPMHDAHIAAGAVMMNVGAWQRPRYYPRPGEGLEQAYVREARAVRTSVGIADVSTLGKIDIQGPDAAQLLDRIYTNTFSTLPVGKARYGLMLREDGFLFDDGTTWRLSETQYLMTTTTANAAAVLAHMEFLLATAWPELKVAVNSVTEQWAGIAVSGPDARALLQTIVDDVDLSNEMLPFMGVRAGHVRGVPVLMARLSFSGELAFEIFCGADFGASLWAVLLDEGQAFGCIAYGLEALGTLRIEKGHVAGAELDGRTTVHDLGLEKMHSRKKDFVGKPLSMRAALTDPTRKQLVGLKSLDGKPVRNGAHLVATGTTGPSQGHVTSMAFSPVLDCYIALALLERGRTRHGEQLAAADPVRGFRGSVEICAPCFFDPSGSRMHA